MDPIDEETLDPLNGTYTASEINFTGYVDDQLTYIPPTPPLPVVLATPFISTAELSTHIYAAVVTAISDSDITILPTAIAAATNEAMGYMDRYDYLTILGQTGAARDPLLLLYIKDIAVYHFMVLANPNIDYEVRLDRYKYAVRWLEKIQTGRFVPAGWPPAINSQFNTEFHVISARKRSNNY